MGIGVVSSSRMARRTRRGPLTGAPAPGEVRPACRPVKRHRFTDQGSASTRRLTLNSLAYRNACGRNGGWLA